ncbi:hypothetical protein [Krasilnikovia cinnamomea]|nr:hypothetical protein [Krasilnikovia cinnamomea]
MMTDLAQRIAARLHETLDQRVGAEISVQHAERGLAAGGPDFPIIALTVEEVARIAARVARETPAAPDATPGAGPGPDARA